MNSIRRSWGEIALVSLVAVLFFVVGLSIRSDRERIEILESCLSAKMPPVPKTGSDPCYQVRSLREQLHDEIRAQGIALKLIKSAGRIADETARNRAEVELYRRNGWAAPLLYAVRAKIESWRARW